ncbi:family 1 encapsulin nanocompartment shell protein [Marinobacter bohaiensis]|uniref:family 1 encapsulin nanocompartment shell protein n=1 Tax=Marinobacter bohaiensis TaxID=2201898 RepID=UPI000DAC2517|nr:family 1 encapsulin nanocompartment shell protein [Marinobacter bohaiensis]
MNYLNRGNASFSQEIWEQIDQVAVTAAREILTGRRFLDVDGPYGVGLTAIEVGEEGYCRQPAPDEAGAVLSRAVAIPMLRKSFDLSVRRLEGFQSMGQPLDLRSVEDAAEAVARREEEFIYYGQPDFGLEGLMTAQGRNEVKCADWSKIEEALNDVLAAVNHLDDKGFHGPYALALSPRWYNLLFRRYEGTDMLQLEHLKRLCEVGVFKAEIEGGVLVDPRAGRIIVGQDLMTGYSSNDGIHHQMFASESLVLRVEEPGAICSLSKKK